MHEGINNSALQIVLTQTKAYIQRLKKAKCKV